MSEYKSEIPWHNTKKWDYKKWYPLPLGYMERNTKGWIHDSWGIFKLDEPVNEGDIVPIIGGDLTFSQAVKICEDFNGVKFIELGDE